MSMSAAKVALLGAVICASAALSSCSGQLEGSEPDSGTEGGGCGDVPPGSAVREVSLAMTQVNFGDTPDPTAWQTIGFDLDGKCTTATSTDVCMLMAGAPQSTQTDGMRGIDNSFGANLCPILDTVVGAGACSTLISQAYVVTDARGSGTLAFQLSVFSIEIPIADATVASDGGAGTLGTVASAEDVVDALTHATIGAYGCPSFGGDPGVSTIAEQVLQASDILADGSNLRGATVPLCRDQCWA
jgi:hypothetical protein